MLEPWQRELLEACRVGHLGTLMPDGRARLAPVCYAVIGGLVAIAIDEKPKSTTELARVRDVRRDPRVTFLVDHYDDNDWGKLAWVRLEAIAEVLERGSEWPEALAALRARYRQYGKMALESRPVLRLAISRATGWQATDAEA